MGYEGEVTDSNKREMLMDVCSILMGASLNGIATQIEMAISYTAPSIVSTNTSIETFFKPGTVKWRYAMIMEIRLTLEQYDFTSDMLIFLSEDSFQPLIGKLDQLLEDL